MSPVKTAHIYTGQSYNCTRHMTVPNVWTVFPPPAVQFDFIYRTVGKVDVCVLSVVCISDSSTVTGECIQKPEEILFMFIITKEQVLKYCTSFSKNYSTLQFTFYHSSFNITYCSTMRLLKIILGRRKSLNWNV